MSSRRRAQRPREDAPAPASGGNGELRAAAIVVGAFFAVALFAGAAIGAFVLFGGSDGDGPPRAVIVDQLNLTSPNQEFVDDATALLERAGYQVDYSSGSQITVEFYRELGTHGYDIVLVRAHAGRYEVDGVPTDDTRLFTNEPYTTRKHVTEQRRGLLSIGAYEYEDPAFDEQLFAIPAGFVANSMRGDFDGASVVLMGCDVLRGEQLANAFVEKGASTVVGWDAPVTAAHTDAATLALLEEHLFGGLAVEDAAAGAMDELGPDPYYGAALLSYPREG